MASISEPDVGSALEHEDVQVHGQRNLQQGRVMQLRPQQSGDPGLTRSLVHEAVQDLLQNRGM